MTTLLKLWDWAAHHRPAWGVISAIAWAVIMYLFIGDAAISLLCGAAFGLISARTLPLPPPQPQPRHPDQERF